MGREMNRAKRRDQKREKRRHGQRGGTGKRMVLIQQQIINRGKEAEKDRKSNSQPTE